MSVVVKAVSSWWSGATFDKECIDPISVLALTALINFKESMTRIKFKGPRVVAQQPSEYNYGYNWQWAFRSLQGQSHENLYIIRESIERVARWHLTDQANQVDVKNLFDHCIKGLEALQETYRSKNLFVTVDAIQLWKLIIKQYKKAGPQPTELNSREQQIRDLWTLEQIKEINALIGQMKDEPNPKDEIERLEVLLRQHADRLKEITQPA